MYQANSPAARLSARLQQESILSVPACFDALSARLIEQAGFEAGFMSGFGVSASRLGLPDTGLISFGEILDQGRNLCAAVNIPLFGDGDTGYGSAQNVKRTVRAYAQAGFAAIMLEDQQWPKRCGHTQGKQVVERSEALRRIRAAVDARNEGADILILARTDARSTHSLDEAISRCQAFIELGADMTFLEAPESIEEMQYYCDKVPGIKMANMLEQGKTPILPPAELQALGYSIATYPLTLLSSAIRAMQDSLQALKQGQTPSGLLDFAELRDLIGFNTYDAEEARYR